MFSIGAQRDRFEAKSIFRKADIPWNLKIDERRQTLFDLKR